MCQVPLTACKNTDILFFLLLSNTLPNFISDSRLVHWRFPITIFLFGGIAQFQSIYHHRLIVNLQEKSPISVQMFPQVCDDLGHGAKITTLLSNSLQGSQCTSFSKPWSQSRIPLSKSYIKFPNVQNFHSPVRKDTPVRKDAKIYPCDGAR